MDLEVETNDVPAALLTGTAGALSAARNLLRNRLVTPLLAGACAAALLVGVAGAQIVPPDAAMAKTQADSGFKEPSDPLEGLNRKIFSFNLALDHAVLRPTAKAYRWVVPKQGRRSISNFLDNINTPVVLANDLLQGEFTRAGEATARFGLNSTFGIGGLFDVARTVGLDQQSEDFGQTLGTYGVGGAPYLMVPFFGPTDPRDGLGSLVDQVFNPLSWTGGDSAVYYRLGQAALNIVSQREAVLDSFDEIERTSLDFYAQTRSIFYQTRANAIKNGKTDFSDLPDIPNE